MGGVKKVGVGCNESELINPVLFQSVGGGRFIQLPFPGEKQALTQRKSWALVDRLRLDGIRCDVVERGVVIHPEDQAKAIELMGL